MPMRRRVTLPALLPGLVLSLMSGVVPGAVSGVVPGLAAAGAVLGWATASRAATKATLAAEPDKDPDKAKAKDQPHAAAAYRPDLPLVTQDNQTVRFYDDLIAGRIALINFIFTTCTSICPPMTANLAQVQRLLKDVLGDRVVMISITVDPQTDTPAVLKAYAARYGAGPGWYFLTGTRENINAVVSKFGDNSRDKLRHSGMLLIGNDPARSWVKGFAMTPPEDIAASVRRMLERSPSPPAAPPR